MGLRLELLGGFRASVAGESLDISAKKSRALLAYLALCRDFRCSRDKLAALLWESSDDAQARNSLRQALAGIRRALPDAARDCLIADADSIGFADGLVRTDVGELEELAGAGRPETLARAAELYRGDLLDGDVPRAPAFEDWLMIERRRLQEKALLAMDGLIDYCLREGEAARGIEVAVRALALDPVRETVHRALMQLYARQGQLGAALRQYRVCRTRLLDELGVAPDPDTERVHAEVLAQRRGLGGGAAPPVAADSPEAELRQATILIARGAASAAPADPEELHRRLSAYFERVDGVVVDHGGTVAKHLGDTVMATFGVPVARSNDLERAIAAAAEIHRSVAELTGAPRIRIGIASGRIVVDELGSAHYRERTVIGDAVARAAALADGAAPGTTALSEASEVELAAAGVAATFVGRQRELRQFAAAADTCVELGAGYVFLVRGDAGIGKTRLVEELSALAAARGFDCHRAGVLDFGGGGGDRAVAALVGSLYRPGALHPDREVFCNALLQLPQPQELAPVYEAMDAATRARGKRRVLSELVFAASARRPLFLWVDDIHWAGADSLELLASVFGTVRDCPAILVMTSRDDEEPTDVAWQAVLQGHSITSLHLGPLRDEDAWALTDTVAGLDRQLAQQCIERAGGNPLFLVQLLSAGGELGAQVPGSVQSLVRARMDRLEPADRKLLQAAALLGPRIDPAALAHVLDCDRVDDASLAARGWLRVDGSDRVFAHAIVRDAVYSSMLADQRRSWHRRAAAYYAGRDAALEAEHLQRCGDPGAATAFARAARQRRAELHYEAALRLAERGAALAQEGAQACELAMLRAELLRDLGEVEQSLAALDEAERHATGTDVRCRISIARGAALRLVDRADEALAALDEAFACAREQQLRAELAEIHYLRGNLFFPTGDFARCLEEHQRALELAREIGDTRAEVRALGGVGDAHYARGHMLSAQRAFGECVEHCRAHGHVDVEVAHLAMRGYTKMFSFELESGIADCLRAIELAGKLGDQRGGVLARAVTGEVYRWVGETERAEQQAVRGLALARRLGSPRFEAELLWLRADLALARGEVAAARALLADALELAERGNEAYCGPQILGVLARAWVGDGAHRPYLERGEQILAAGALSHNYLDFYLDAIEVALAAGEWDEVDRYADALIAYTRGEPLPWSDFWAARGRALARAGRGGLDRAVRAELESLRERAAKAGLLRAMPALHALL